MAETLLVADALDERDFLKKKITDAIQNSAFIAVKRTKDPALKNGVAVEDFEKKAASQYQSVSDMIDRYNRINAAIVLSNATTEITLKSGIKMTRAEAIARKKIIANHNDDLEGKFITAIANQYNEAQNQYESLKQRADSAAEDYKRTLSGRDRQLTDEEAKAAAILTEGEQPKIIDPLDLAKKYEERKDKYSVIIKEIDTAIKISNATTTIEI